MAGYPITLRRELLLEIKVDKYTPYASVSQGFAGLAGLKDEVRQGSENHSPSRTSARLQQRGYQTRADGDPWPGKTTILLMEQTAYHQTSNQSFSRKTIAERYLFIDLCKINKMWMKTHSAGASEFRSKLPFVSSKAVMIDRGVTAVLSIKQRACG